MEGLHKYGDNWKRMDETDLHAYIGLLILVGVHRSRGEATSSLWDTEWKGDFPCHNVAESFSTPSQECFDLRIRDIWEKWVEFFFFLVDYTPYGWKQCLKKMEETIL